MVEHEVAMAIHHLNEWKQCNVVNSSYESKWIAVECALSWLQDAQDKMDIERKTRLEALELLDKECLRRRSLLDDMTDQGKWDVKYGRGAK